VYPITDRQLSGLSHAEQVAKLIDAGAKLIQLREKLGSPQAFYEDARAALQVARARGAKIIINDRADIALALNADGVHLGQEDLPPEAARRLLGPQAIIGFSTHNLEQAEQALDLPIDYVAIGPIFATTTKVSSNPAVGLDKLALIRKTIGDLSLVAIGGITAGNLQTVLDAGADAVALISDVWRADGQLNPKFSKFLKS
jgi:thiamine-phosphate pyrophosphorylase